MYGEYFRQILKSVVHEHFPDFESQRRVTIEDAKEFIVVIQSYDSTNLIDRALMTKMKRNFMEYKKRRMSSTKTYTKPCTGTIGKWSRKRSQAPIMEATFTCYDQFYFQNWIKSELLDRIVWNNIIPVILTDLKCPCGTKSGIVFIID